MAVTTSQPRGRPGFSSDRTKSPVRKGNLKAGPMTQKGTVARRRYEGLSTFRQTKQERIASGTHGNPYSVLSVQEFRRALLPASSPPAPIRSRLLPLTAEPPGNLSRARFPDFSKDSSTFHSASHCVTRRQMRTAPGRLTIPTPMVPCLVRWMITSLRKARICDFSTSLAPIRCITRGPTGCISPSGRQTPGACPLSAISTVGTAAAMSCGFAPMCGNILRRLFLSPGVNAGSALQNMKSSGPTGRGCRSRRIPLPAAPKCGPPPRRS